MEHVFDLTKTSFDPPPRVESSVVKITRRLTPLTDRIPSVQRVIQAAFQQRRKIILNSLSHGLQLPKKKVQVALAAVGVPESLRPEDIAVDKFIALTERLLLKQDLHA
jgi:16S rRNA (adenine1518-N6/adenine1519-N6)-dimethyltransferase